MILGCYLGKPTQLRALAPVWDAACRRGWTPRWYGPGCRTLPDWHPADVPRVMVAVDPPAASLPTRWIWLQTGMDPFLDPRLPGTDATLAVYTDWWAAQLPRGVRAEVVGFPILPPRPGPSVLVYVPWSVRSGAHGRWQRWRQGRRHRRLVTRLAEYCDLLEMPLRVKVRRKDPVPPALRAWADEVVTDESGAGDTLDWLAGAWGCLHVYSSVVLEAAALGVPSLCLDPGPGWGHSRYATGDRGGPFHWPGVVEWRELDDRPFSPPPRFTIFPPDLADYRARYVGETEGAAERVCDLAEKLA